MPHPRGKRSDEAVTRREARRLDKVNHTLRDPELAETVCILPFDRILKHFSPKTGESFKEKVTVDWGEVMADSRGRGTFQI